MSWKEAALLTVLLVMFSAFATGLSLGSDSLTDYVENGTEELENTTQEVTDSALGEESVSGILLPTSDSLSDRISTIRQSIPDSVPSHSYFLISENNRYLVFANEDVSVGEYKAAGTKFPAVDINRKSHAVLLVDNVENNRPEKVNLGELERNTEEYQYQEIEVSGVLREVSVSTDYQTHLTSSLSFGAITTTSSSDKSFVGNIRDSSENIVRNPEWSTFRTAFDVREPRIPLVDLNPRYWANSEAEITGVVLPPEEMLQIERVSGLQTENIVEGMEENEAIYVEEVNYPSKQVDINELHSTEPGKNVRFTGEGLVKTLRLQEVLASSGINIPVDAVLKAGVITDSDNPSENVIIIGVSPRKGQIESISGGRYEIKGKTVSAQSLDPSFPSNRNIVVIHQLQKKFEIENIRETSEISDKEEFIDSIMEGEDIAYSTNENSQTEVDQREVDETDSPQNNELNRQRENDEAGVKSSNTEKERSSRGDLLDSLLQKFRDIPFL